MKKITIIGGSGFIGTTLINKLKNKYEIRNFDIREVNIPGIHTELVDVRDKDSLLKIEDDTDLIILLAAEHTDNVRPISLYYDVNVTGAQNVLEVMARKGIKKMIFTSTVAVYGLDKDNPSESSPIDPFNDYGKSKWHAEEVLRSWYNEKTPSDKSLVILRPTVVFGEGNKGNVYNLLRQIKSGRFFLVGSGQNKKSMSYVENIVSFMDFLIGKMSAGYELYNYADKPDLTTRELIDIIFEKLSVKKKPIKVPYFVGYLGGCMFDVLATITKKKYAISRVRIKKFCATTKFSSEKMTETGFQPPYTLKQGLGKTIDSI